MKRIVCIIALVCSSAALWACYYPSDSPSGYKYYHVGPYREHPRIDRPNYTEQNLKLWQQYAGGDIALEQIAEVVYRYTVTDMQQCMRDSRTERCQKNAFAKRIFADSAQYAARLLLLAKQVEWVREVYNDPWYYPATKNESSLPMLQQAIEDMIVEMQEAQEEKRGFYIERLMLQKTRVLFASHQYEACIRLWQEQVEKWDKRSLMRSMIKSYVAGAYAKTGQKELACQYFLELGNYQALADICHSKEKRYTEFIRRLYDHRPDCAQIVAPVLQSELLELGQAHIGSANDSAVCAQYYELMQYVIGRHRSKDMSLWYYTAAYLEDQMGKPEKAVQSIYKAQQYPTTELMQRSIRMMRMYLEAKTKTYDLQYEMQLFADLRWMDRLIKADSTRLKRLWEKGELDEWTIWHNMSCLRDGNYICYPYTMMRKIILAEVAPRMVKAGKPEMALALCNYADNMLLKMLSEDKCHCFKNSFFVAMDTAGARVVERYAECALKPESRMMHFLVAGSYVDKDFLYDIAGTLYLRERKYKKAMEVLSRVESSYQSRLNTQEYLRQDPFDLGNSRPIEKIVDGKYTFACQMYQLEQIYQNPNMDANRRAYAIINYAIGMRNSYTKAWALTQYFQGYIIPGHWTWLNAERKARMEKDYDRLVEQAFAMFTNDEAKALAYLRYRNNRTIITQYPKTSVAEYVRGCCDTYYDYYPIYTPKSSDNETNY